MQLYIPQPCAQDWSAMTPAQGGRHCAECAKTVIDFTRMSAAEIAQYLQARKGQSICGRFRQSQLEQLLPGPDVFVKQVAKSPLPFLQRIAAIILFAFFLSACNTGGQEQTEVHLTGDTAYAPAQPAPQPLTDTPRFMNPDLKPEKGAAKPHKKAQPADSGMEPTSVEVQVMGGLAFMEPISVDTVRATATPPLRLPPQP